MTEQALTLIDFAFYVVSAGIVGTAMYAVFSPNITRSVFSLLGTFFGVAILYGMLAADFVAVIQLMVYVGGILVLMIFAVMLTENIDTAFKNNQSSGLWFGAIVGLVIFSTLAGLAVQMPWNMSGLLEYLPITADIGNALLGKALLPFEVVSIILLGIVIGAVVIARSSRMADTSSEEGDQS